MDKFVKAFQKRPFYNFSLLLLTVLSIWLAVKLALWPTETKTATEFIPANGRLVQYGGAPDQSISNTISLFLNPDGGQNISRIVATQKAMNMVPGAAENQFKQVPSAFGDNSLTVGDAQSLAIAKGLSKCLDEQNGEPISQQKGGRSNLSESTSCQPRTDWNYVAQAGGANNSVSYLGNPFNANQSELYNQFFRDVQNNLAEHSVENFRYPYSSTLTSSYRNSAQYCGIGKTVNDCIKNDHCFNTTEYQNFYNKDKSAPDVINTQIKPYNRRLRRQIAYNPVKLYDEIIPENGFLNEKPANFTSEHTRTFDWFTSAGLGHVDYIA